MVSRRRENLPWLSRWQGFLALSESVHLKAPAFLFTLLIFKLGNNVAQINRGTLSICDRWHWSPIHWGLVQDLLRFQRRKLRKVLTKRALWYSLNFIPDLHVDELKCFYNFVADVMIINKLRDPQCNFIVSFSFLPHAQMFAFDCSVIVCDNSSGCNGARCLFTFDKHSVTFWVNLNIKLFYCKLGKCKRLLVSTKK